MSLNAANHSATGSVGNAEINLCGGCGGFSASSMQTKGAYDEWDFSASHAKALCTKQSREHCGGFGHRVFLISQV
uniref:Uncharacterized protein n=1 Tax=mine drainage metagenome TaxID=410659 RepID=E6PZK0_9ZZZZ